MGNGGLTESQHRPVKLRKGQPRYRMPPYSNVIHVVLTGKFDRMLPMVDVCDLNPVPLKPAEPTRCGIYGQFIEFEPPPDRAYTVRIRYAPPILEA